MSGIIIGVGFILLIIPASRIGVFAVINLIEGKTFSSISQTTGIPPFGDLKIILSTDSLLLIIDESKSPKIVQIHGA